MKSKPTIVKAIISSVLILLGVYAVIIRLGNGDIGRVGVFYYEHILRPLFGDSFILFAGYLILVGIFLLFSTQDIKRIACLSIVFFPSVFIYDDLLDKGTLISHSLIGYRLKSSLVYLFGKYGLYLIEFLMIVSGLYGLYPFQLLNLRSKKVALFSPKKNKSSQKNKPEKGDTPRKEKKNIPNLEPEIKSSSDKVNSIKDFSNIPAIPEVELLDFNGGDFKYNKPTIDIFKPIDINSDPNSGDRKNDILEVFSNYKLGVDIGEIHTGPSVEKYQLLLKKGSRFSQIKKFEEDIALALGSKININSGQDNKLFLESPRLERQDVAFRYLLETGDSDQLKIPLYLGVDSSFKTVLVDLAELPHLMVAGTTGSGKSILVKSIIASMMYKMDPRDLKLILIDPKRVEFSAFNSSVFMAGKSIYESDRAEKALNQVVDEMEKRYCILEQHKVSNIGSYNEKVNEKSRLPYLVVIIDEFADLIMSNSKINDSIVKLAQKARACGIHLILATQRPSADVINGLLKANIPGRIALSVSSGINSRIILDKNGAENLLGKGDMILLSNKHPEGIRLQGAFISDKEIEKLVQCSSLST